MLTTKIRGDDLTKSTDVVLASNKAGRVMVDYHPSSSNKRQKTSNVGTQTIELLPPGSGTTFGGGPGGSTCSDGDVRDCLSTEAVAKMTRSVVSVLLFDGDTVVFSCSGIPIERNLSYIKIMTSANLKTATDTKRKLASTMRIQVRDAFNNVAPACLDQRDLDNGIAFVIVSRFLDVCAVNLHHAIKSLPHSDLVAIQLTDSGAVTPVKGTLIKDSGASEGGELLCQAGDGGPLFDHDGNFVGMNLLRDKGRCTFVQRSVIVEQLEQLRKMNELRARAELGAFRPRLVPTGERRLREPKYILI